MCVGVQGPAKLSPVQACRFAVAAFAKQATLTEDTAEWAQRNVAVAQACIPIGWKASCS